MRLSVIVRFHEGANIDLLRRALYCLLDETALTLEAIVMVQFSDTATIDSVKDLCASLFVNVPYRVEGVATAPGADRRGQLLGDGISYARGDYVAFLDYDDMLFVGSVARVIEICDAEAADMAIAQCYAAYVEGVFPNDYIVTKERFVIRIPPDPLFLIAKNFAPVCSFVVSRRFLVDNSITVSRDAQLLEDYELVLKILAAGKVTLRPLAEGIVSSQYNFNVDAGGTTLLMDNDADARAREDTRWEIERQRMWTKVLPQLSRNIDFMRLRDLLLAPIEAYPEVLNLLAFVQKVRGDRAKA